MDTRKKLRAFVRFDGSGRVVPGSLVLRKRKPKVGRWQEVTADECCQPVIPPKVSDPVVGAVTATTIDITWEAATVSPGMNPIMYYSVKLDGTEVALVAPSGPLAYQYTDLIETSYDLSIGAVTADGETLSNVVAQVTA